MRLPRYIRLLLRPPSLDFDTAVWDAVHIVWSPRKVFSSLQSRQQITRQWARDDPSFVVLLTLSLTISALAWGISYSSSFLGVLKLIVYMVVVDFLAVGNLVAAAGWALATYVLRRPNTFGPVEWAYCFDIHCDAFLVIWLWLYVGQWVALPILDRANWVSVFLSNLLYTVAIIHYCFITFLGYSALPQLRRTQLLLLPVILIIVLELVATFCKFSTVRFMLTQYFG